MLLQKIIGLRIKRIHRLVPCGFESHYPYSLSEILNRDKISIVNVHEPVLQSFEGHILKQKGTMQSRHTQQNILQTGEFLKRNR